MVCETRTSIPRHPVAILVALLCTCATALGQALPSGSAGLGTYATSAQFQSPTLSANNQLFLQPDLSKNRGNFSFTRGEWRVIGNTLQQSSADTGTRAVVPVDAADYTLTVKAKKLSGKEGFLVIFRLKDARNYAWFNVGGWNNTKAQVEVTYNATRTAVGPSAPFTVETGRWYDLKVDVQGNWATCSIDGKQICRTDISPPRPGQGTVSQQNVDTADNTARESTITQQLASPNKAENAKAYADLKKWFAEDPVNAEHAFWRRRAAFPALTDRVAETMELIQLAWNAKNSANGDHSDPGYLYALEASCLFQQNKPDQAKAKAQAGLKADPVHASEELVVYLGKAPPPAAAASDILELLPDVLTGKPEDAAAVEDALKLRIALLNGLNRPADALADAKRLFNISTMRRTADAITVLDRQLQLAHPADRAIDEQFRKEQLEGAAASSSGAAVRTSAILAGITTDSAVFEQALSHAKGSATPDLIKRTHLLLLAGKAQEAGETAQKALSNARAARNTNDINTLSELVARCLKAQDGTIGRANAFVAAARAAAPAPAANGQGQAADDPTTALP